MCNDKFNIVIVIIIATDQQFCGLRTAFFVPQQTQWAQWARNETAPAAALATARAQSCLCEPVAALPAAGATVSARPKPFGITIIIDFVAYVKIYPPA